MTEELNKIAIVNIDDLLPMLRGLRRIGYGAKRQGKLSIWKVYPLDLVTSLLTVCLIKQIYVDTTRTVPCGVALTLDAPKWELDLRPRADLLVEDIVWSRRTYGGIEYTNPTLY